MSKLHILEATGEGQFRIAIHTAVPAGNNAAGKAWKDVLLASGRSGTTALAEGIGPGQVDAAERATIVAGDIIEIIAAVPLESGGATAGSLNASMTDIVAAWKMKQQAELRRYGQVVA